MDAVTLALIKSMAGKGGGGSLPSVTSADNGKVLGVVNGAWAADENILNVTYANSTLSHTYAEIVAAIDAGKTVTITYSGKKYFAQYYSTTNVIFSYQSNISKTLSFCKVTNANTISTNEYDFVPTPYAGLNGSELIVKNGSWTAQQKKFIVTLTPTALDYSGTMDKTETEISDAYEAGQQIVFRVVGIPEYDYVDVNVTEALYYTSVNRWQMSAYLVMLPDTLIYIYNGISSDGDYARYGTRVFTLTPAS